MEISLDQPQILNWSIPLHKNLSLTLVLHGYHCKVFATFSLQTLALKTPRYQVHWAVVKKFQVFPCKGFDKS